nr:uncharacterized protein LOC125423747 [Ziziphus jujuba var. spinosa]
MKILSWNVRGLGNPRTFRAFTKMLKTQDPDIVFLMETKLLSRQLERLRLCSSMAGVFGVDRVGLSGGLALLWKQSLNVSIKSFSPGQNLFPRSVVQHLPNSVSDHQALCLLLDGSAQLDLRPGNRFHFESVWLGELECANIIDEEWNFTPSGTVTMHDVIQKVEDEINCLLDKEESRWKQRSRVCWLREGDRNTRYFHVHASSRRRRNLIRGVMDSNGLWSSSPQHVVGAFMAYFQDLFTTKGSHIESDLSFGVRGRVTDFMNAELCKPFTADELKTSLFQMNPSKAPGHDGFPAMFYQHYWPSIGATITKACLQILNDGADMGNINHTLIALVPKVSDPSNVSDYRPISLGSVIYKMISKTLVNRLKAFLPKLISEEQSAFVPGRQITDNVLVAFEHMHFIGKKYLGQTGLMALKLDMSKAYDRVEWDFLRWIMQEMGFSARWINLVMACVTGVSYSLLINGRQQGFFKPTCGLRQGDPLSPYLFLFVSEGLSCLLRKSLFSNLLTGISIAPSSPPISHLFFADDTILFTHATPSDCQQILSILHLYERASGQKINMQKTVATFSPNTPQSVRNIVFQEFQIERNCGHDRYLGLPSFIGRRTVELFQSIKERVWHKLEGWNGKLLSRGGKEILLKAVIQSIPTYTMSCFKLPKKLIKDLSGLMTRFWWGSYAGKRGIPWKNWMQLTQPKSQGGLGFRSLEEFNRALLAKQCWRIVRNPSSLLARVVKAKYFPRCSFWEAGIGRQPSHSWRSLVWGRRILETGGIWRVGDGKSIRIYKDSWLPGVGSSRILSPRILPEDATVACLLTDSGAWNLNLLQASFSTDEVEVIKNIPIDGADKADRFAWKFSPTGLYTVRTGYWEARKLGVGNRISGSSDLTVHTWWKGLWKLSIPNKVKVFIWRACQDAIPCLSSLASRHITDIKECPLCHQAEETTLHALWSCMHATHIWKQLEFYKELKYGVYDSFTALCFYVFTQCPEFQLETFSWACWCLWNKRHDLVHGNCIKSDTQLLDSISRLHVEFKEATMSTNIRRPNRAHQRWEPPHGSNFKINVDASVLARQNRVGIGVVVRNSSGELMGAVAKPFEASWSVMYSELMAIHVAIDFCMEAGFVLGEIISDCLGAVRAFNMGLPEASLDENCFLVEKLQKLLTLCPNLTLSFESREKNNVAHCIGKYATGISNLETWLEEGPQRLLNLLCADMYNNLM